MLMMVIMNHVPNVLNTPTQDSMSLQGHVLSHNDI